MSLTTEQQQVAKDTKLSRFFTLWEMIKSDSAPNLVEFPDERIVEHLTDFAEKVLEPIRKTANDNKVMYINSGYRNPKLNAKVGGTKHSIHQIYHDNNFLGVAADIVPLSGIFDTYSLMAVMKLKGLKTAIIYPDRGFIHVDSNVNRSQPAFFIKFRTSGHYHAITPIEARDIRQTLLKKFSLVVS